MKVYAPLARYPVGSVVCSREGYIKVKVAKKGDHAWIPESHLVATTKRLARPDPKDIGKPIAKDERVFHIGVNKSDNSADNLVVIKIRLEKYVLLPTSKVLYIPEGQTLTVAETLKARGLA
jgi:hypothetical protein